MWGMESMYQDGRYVANNPSWHSEDSAWKAAHVLRLLAKHQLKPRRVAEVGCGAGEVLRHLHLGLGGAATCEGWDLSPQALAMAERVACQGLSFHHGDLLAQPASPLDVMLAIDVLEHVEDYLGFLRQLRGRARHTVLHIPLELSVQTVWRATPLAVARQAVGHLHFFTRETALASLVHAGFEVIDSQYTAGALELPPRHLAARLLRGPRRLLRAMAPHAAARLLGGFSLLVLAR